ncbi:deaminase domain-containing protein [Thermoactinomyces sp. CICC 10521]|uniref:deaminase domain-containing protein n=1 Tax=Thermoactinomyces sp. CICC 10521 TaxID=2767426 RepID=UPI0018DD6B81|nr:hypothetical protein [Thermoactinomyces sp. CICC 10521]
MFKWVVVMLLIFAGAGLLGHVPVYAESGSFQVPEVNDHFDKVKSGPAPAPSKAVTEAKNENHSFWKEMKDGVSSLWSRTKQKISAAWQKTKEAFAEAWDWIAKVCDRFARVVVDGLSAAWDWVWKYKGYILFTVVIIVGVVLCFIAPPLGASVLGGAITSFGISVLLNGGKIDQSTFLEGGIGGVLGLCGMGFSAALERGLGWLGVKMLPYLSRFKTAGALMEKGSRWISRFPKAMQKLFSRKIVIGAGEGAGTTIVDDWLHGRKFSFKRVLAGALTGGLLVGGYHLMEPVIQPAVQMVKASVQKQTGPVLAKLEKYLARSADPCFGYQPMPKYFAAAEGPLHCFRPGSGPKDVISYSDQLDPHGWASPTQKITPELLAKQTQGLSTEAEKSRKKLIEEIIELVGTENKDKATKQLTAKGYSKNKANSIVKFRDSLLDGGKNFATAKVEIAGISEHELKAYSGKNIPIFEEGWVKEVPRDKFKFDYVKAKEGQEEVYPMDYQPDENENIGHGRQYDSEPKILEYISSKLGNSPGKEGDRLILFTERRTCPGCQGKNRKLIKADNQVGEYDGSIDQFSKLHPKIEVIVYDGEGRRLILKGGKVVTPKKQEG